MVLWTAVDFFSNIRGHSKLFSTNVEQTTMFRTQKGLWSGNIGSKSAEFVVGSDSIVTLTQPDSTDLLPQGGSKPQKLLSQRNYWRERFSNDDGDGNENVKKSSRFIQLLLFLNMLVTLH